MERLTLKNLYRVIRARDYPVYSDGVLPEAGVKGLTLISFWKEVLCARWLQTPHGLIIWRSEGSINKYHSQLCNRKGSFPFYEKYTREILEGLTEEEFFQQAKQFSHFLTARHYRSSVLRQKLSVLLNQAQQSDAKLGSFAFSRVFPDGQRFPEVDTAFLDGWILSWMTLLAITDDPAGLASFFQDHPALLPDALYTRFALSPAEKIDILTVQSSELWHGTLSPEHFFGREQELFDLTEAVLAGEKVLVCGPGGAGKTELVRQMLERLISRHAFTHFATVQYHDNLPRSFARSFLHLTGSSVDECFHESLYILSSHEHSLLLVDNVDRSDDPALAQLSGLPGPVVLTGRFSSLPGFRPLRILNPDARAATLIFRSHYHHQFQPEDRELFHRMMDQDFLRHPLTVTLMAKGAQANGWSVRELGQQVEVGYENIPCPDGSGNLRLSQILKRLYRSSVLEPARRKLIRLLSILPYQEYTAGDLEQFSGVTKNLPLHLSWLSSHGWLDITAGGAYVMHPWVAECIRMKKPAESEFPALWAFAERLPPMGARHMMDGEGIAVRQGFWDTILHAAGTLPSVSRHLALCCVRACYRVTDDPSLIHQLDQILARTDGEQSDLQLMLDSISMWAGASGREGLRERMEAELAHPTLPCDLGHRYAASCAYLLTLEGESARSAALIAREKSQELTPEELDDLLTVEYVLHNLTNDLPGCLQVAQEALSLAERLEEGRKEKPRTLFWLENLALVQLRLQKRENLEEIRRRIMELRKTNRESVESRIRFENVSAQMAEQEGRLQEAIDIWLRIRELTSHYMGKDSDFYVQASCQTAMLLSKAGQLDKAAPMDEETLRMTEGKPEHLQVRQILLSNYGHVLLKMGRPEEARPFLEESISLAEPTGGIPLAEPRKNLARCFLMKGDRAEAKALFDQVYPVFLEKYGPDHPKVKELEAEMAPLNE